MQVELPVALACREPVFGGVPEQRPVGQLTALPQWDQRPTINPCWYRQIGHIGNRGQDVFDVRHGIHSPAGRHDARSPSEQWFLDTALPKLLFGSPERAIVGR